MKPKKTFQCTDHSGPGGPVRVHRDVPPQRQANRVARTLARRLFGREACYTPPHLLSIHHKTLARHYGSTATGKHGPEDTERRFVFCIETPTA